MATRVDPSRLEKDPPRIPWDEFTDGFWWEIAASEAEGYSGSLTGFRSTLYSYARRNSLTVTTRTLGTRMRFQFKEKK
ncbi:hypothetical protein C4J65_10495 [Streptomyces sp. CB09001]|uniref:hypothetical protein n=1 Tax=Streptomyces sp. CB09001 TaxID=2083284 RepID=UPI000E2104FC|nr:hypothetical protein [Streptomyces sp. CB09001]AXL88708.1 hypothetical protein C4J65_10495 [Streptomyces sp. CB09001]